MPVQRSRPRRPAWLYPAGSILTMRDGRKFLVDVQEIRVYDEFGYMGEEDYLYSKWKRRWSKIT